MSSSTPHPSANNLKAETKTAAKTVSDRQATRQSAQKSNAALTVAKRPLKSPPKKTPTSVSNRSQVQAAAAPPSVPSAKTLQKKTLNTPPNAASLTSIAEAPKSAGSHKEKAVKATKALVKTEVKSAEKPAEKPAEKAKKPKLIRDSFTIPKAEYEVFESLKQRATKLGQTPKKSELLRAGLKALSSMNDKNFLLSLAAVPAIKTGRPKA